jgi:transketolase C-terminal domain/subunit
VAEYVAERHPGTRVLRLGIGDRFVDHGEAAEQWRAEGMDCDAIVARVRATLEGPRG